MEGNTVAKIALQAATYAIDKPYDYQVPPELLDTLRPGMRVVVPFGAGNRRTSWRWRAGTRTTQGARAFSPF